MNDKLAFVKIVLFQVLSGPSFDFDPEKVEVDSVSTRRLLSVSRKLLRNSPAPLQSSWVARRVLSSRIGRLMVSAILLLLSPLKPFMSQLSRTLRRI